MRPIVLNIKRKDMVNLSVFIQTTILFHEYRIWLHSTSVQSVNCKCSKVKNLSPNLDHS